MVKIENGMNPGHTWMEFDRPGPVLTTTIGARVQNQQLRGHFNPFICRFPSQEMSLTRKVKRHVITLIQSDTHLIECRPGARFSKVPKTFRTRKAIRKTPTCLFCKAGFLICCKENKN